MDRKRGLFSEFSHLLFNTYARWKGTGEPWPNCTLKVVKNFPRHFWKIICFLISLYSPLSHGIWILVHHLSIETLASLQHSVIINSMFKRWSDDIYIWIACTRPLSRKYLKERCFPREQHLDIEFSLSQHLNMAITLFVIVFV